SSSEGDIDKRDFLALLATVGGVSTIYCNSEIADGAAFGSVTHFGIARDIPKQKNFIEVGHAAVIAKSLRFCHLFWRFLLLLFETLVMLPVNVRIQSKLRAQPHDRLWIDIQDEVYVITGIERPCHV